MQYYVAEFTAGVSVQRGTTVFTGTSGTGLTQTATLTAVDCTKSWVLTSVRSENGTNTRDEQWTDPRHARLGRRALHVDHHRPRAGAPGGHRR